MDMGGPAALLKWAKENPGDFFKSALARFWPAMPREELNVNTQVNIGNMSDRDLALRIAFVLNKAGYESGEQRPLVQASAPKIIEALPEPKPISDFDLDLKRQDKENLAPQVEAAKANDLVADTRNSDITNYPGSDREQGTKRRNLI